MTTWYLVRTFEDGRIETRGYGKLLSARQAVAGRKGTTGYRVRRRAGELSATIYSVGRRMAVAYHEEYVTALSA